MRRGQTREDTVRFKMKLFILLGYCQGETSKKQRPFSVLFSLRSNGYNYLKNYRMKFGKMKKTAKPSSALRFMKKKTSL